MTAREELTPIFEAALKIVDQREGVYGDSWKQNGKDVCVPEVLRKASYIKAQWERNKSDTDKFREDLLDLLNWSAIAYWHVARGTNDTEETS